MSCRYSLKVAHLRHIYDCYGTQVLNTEFVRIVVIILYTELCVVFYQSVTSLWNALCRLICLMAAMLLYIIQKVGLLVRMKDIIQRPIAAGPYIIWPVFLDQTSFHCLYFCIMRDEVIGEWRKLHNEKLNDLYTSPSIGGLSNREE